MRSLKQAVVAIAAGGLLVAGGTIAGIALTQGTARADNIGFCEASPGTGAQCIESDLTVPDPSSIYVTLATPSNTKSLNANLTWSLSCPSTAAAVSGSRDADTVPSTVYVEQGINLTPSESCTLSVTVFVTNFSANSQNITMSVNYDENTGPGATGTPTASPSSSVPSGGVSGIIKGYDSKCVNDTGNSSKLRAPVVSYACSGAKGKTWRYAAGELIHNGMCLNDKGNAGNGGKLILYSCNGSDDEIWVHQMNNTYELKAHNWTLCLSIPGASKSNGVQLQADTCKNSAAQHWTIP